MTDARTELQLRIRANDIRKVRSLFRECVAEPLNRAVLHRTPLKSAQMVWSIPIEAATSGFTIVMTQGVSCWYVTVTRLVDYGTELQASGEAKSLLKALFQVVNAFERQMDELEAETQHLLQEIEDTANAAA